LDRCVRAEDPETRLCEAKFANLFLYENNSFRIVVQQNAPRAYAERWRRNPILVVEDNPRNPLAGLAAARRRNDGFLVFAPRRKMARQGSRVQVMAKSP
jgi:hypothetical protein